jgi:transposase
MQVGRRGRTVRDVASELACDWHTVNDAVIRYGEALLDADTERVRPTSALGLDETLFGRFGVFHSQCWSTTIVDVQRGILLDLIEGRRADDACYWLAMCTRAWRDRIVYGTLDMSGPYRKVFDTMLPDAVQVIDPFHLVKHANQKLDECRRRVQNETLGHRGRKHDPLYRSRRLLTKGHERLDDKANAKLLSLLEAGDPHGEVRMTWHAKETIRGIYAIDDPNVAAAYLDELVDNMADPSMPIEVRSLAQTLRRWRAQILAWHEARITNAPTEAANNLIKRVKRVAFGFRVFRHYRIRALLYAGRPDWSRIATITP